MTTLALPAEKSHLGEEPHFADLYAAEEKHFWFQHRGRVLGDLFANLSAELPDGYEVLEVGCGNGKMLKVLEQVCLRGKVMGSDLFAEGLQFARQRVACPLVSANVYDLPFADRFDLVGMFDVLEHLPDDARALACLGRILRPGGRLVLTVPAHQELWSYVDVASGHYRRYSRIGLERALHAAGFAIDYLTLFMAPLAPLMMLGRRAATLRNKFRARPADETALALAEFHVNPLVNALITGLLRCEQPLLNRRMRIPLGTSLLAVAQKRA
jgi:SAM-dependent methyltransferase